MLLPEIIPVVLAAASRQDVKPNRTQLQKLLYFVTAKLGHAPVHRPHYYGPYSADVSEATLDLVDLDVVDEDCKVDYGPLDATEIRKYSYSLTETGEEVAELIFQASPTESETIQKTVERLLEASGKDTNRLAVAAKVHYVLKRNPKIGLADSEKICQQAARLGWEIGTNDVTNAIALLGKTDLLPRRT